MRESLKCSTDLSYWCVLGRPSLQSGEARKREWGQMRKPRNGYKGPRDKDDGGGGGIECGRVGREGRVMEEERGQL